MTNKAVGRLSGNQAPPELTDMSAGTLFILIRSGLKLLWIHLVHQSKAFEKRECNWPQVWTFCQVYIFSQAFFTCITWRSRLVVNVSYYKLVTIETVFLAGY